jgi:hypothetical protein
MSIFAKIKSHLGRRETVETTKVSCLQCGKLMSCYTWGGNTAMYPHHLPWLVANFYLTNLASVDLARTGRTFKPSTYRASKFPRSLIVDSQNRESAIHIFQCAVFLYAWANLFSVRLVTKDSVFLPLSVFARDGRSHGNLIPHDRWTMILGRSLYSRSRNSRILLSNLEHFMMLVYP